MAGRPREFDDQLVIQAAMDAFWRNGFEATSAQELVDSTGLGRGSLYAAFGSKENLYHEALRRYHRSSIEFHEEVFRQPGSVKDRLEFCLKKALSLISATLSVMAVWRYFLLSKERLKIKPLKA